MLINAKRLKGYSMDSKDGEIGKVKEFYFDDKHWTVRYLVADSGNWLASRHVLISPNALGAVSREEHHIVINLTKQQIEDSPSLSNDKPVSRQFEEDYYAHYGWLIYWGGPYTTKSQPDIEHGHERWQKSPQDDKKWDSHMRSTHDVSGYHVQAEDGEIGHIEDFVIDDDTWAIRYLIIDTRNWWSGKRVLISPEWIKRISWSDKKVFVDFDREIIKQSPEYSEESMLNRDYEEGLHQHYKRKGYWVDETVADEHSL